MTNEHNILKFLIIIIDFNIYDNLDRLKDEILQQGASLVGVGYIEGLYSETSSQKEVIDIPKYPIGISIAVAIPKEVVRGISKKPTMDYYNTYYSLNEKLDQLAEFCENYIITRGYHAFAQTVNRMKLLENFQTIMPHKTVAVQGGLGWIGKSALLVTPKFGSSIRLTSVLTDAPMALDKANHNSPCNQCDICKNACPGKAITGNVWSWEKGRERIFEPLSCRNFARKIAASELGKEITLCGKCIEVCPYTPNYINN